MSKTRIVIDLDKLSAAVSRYDDIIAEFEESVRATEQAISLLKNSAWKSAASTAYFLQYDDGWKKNMDRRLKIIRHLKDCLVLAQTEYDAVYQEMDGLDSDL